VVEPVMKVVVAAMLSEVVAEVLVSSTVNPLASIIVEEKNNFFEEAFNIILRYFIDHFSSIFNALLRPFNF
jgi:hypothetical protein